MAMRLLSTIAKISPAAIVAFGIAFSAIVDGTEGVEADEYVVWNDATAKEGNILSALLVVVPV
ncbi:hypothetical protein PtrV1_10089 [Pyrenophora tritici-repentis]|nr:hypothetical protein PtrV1_10089 [Pyrenophora tritici-repentis]KAF7446081.1 hypothetical protein A1F99_093720 [Pyrenophora tritici-repentis]KAI0614700.1 hypothetical protein TUN205_01090 [Pyrenophora tritici-repentis]